MLTLWQSIKRRRRERAGCVGIGRFLESTNINQVSVSRESSPSRAPTTRGFRVPCSSRRRGGGRRDTAVTITCLEGTKGVAPVGRVGGAWRRVPRQFATRLERSSLEWAALYARWPGPLVPHSAGTLLCRWPAPRMPGHGYPDRNERANDERWWSPKRTTLLTYASQDFNMCVCVCVCMCVCVCVCVCDAWLFLVYVSNEWLLLSFTIRFIIK